MLRIIKLPTAGAFLRGRRETLHWSRATLAEKATVSASYIRSLEADKHSNVSPAVFDAISSALDLSQVERIYVRHLLHSIPVRNPEPLCRAATSEQIRWAERQMPDFAGLNNRRWDVLAANDAAEELFPGVRESGNMIKWMLGPIGRDVFIDWEGHALGLITVLRMIMAQFGNPDWGQELLAELEQDPLFVELWNRNRLADAQNDRRMNLITEKGPRTLQLQYNSILGTDQTAPIEGELVEFEGSPEQQAAADRQWRALCDRGFWQPPAQKASSFPT